MFLHVCHISTFPPTQCGIATYADDLVRHQTDVVPSRVRLTYPTDQPDRDSSQIRIRLNEVRDYGRAAVEINQGNFDVISLQHEFGIFGGQDGEHVLELVLNLKAPVVTTLHTVYSEMPAGKARILRSLASFSAHLVVLTEECKEALSASFGISHSKISVIHHGIPDVQFMRPEQSGLRSALDCDLVLISAGHIKPKKGHDIALRALAKLHETHPNFKYLIVGSSQQQFDPNNCHEAKLREAVEKEGLLGNVIRLNRYLDREELIDAIRAADAGLVTYTTADQTSSGVLPLILGCGRPVVATDFGYARSVASRASGVLLAKMNNSDAVYENVRYLIENRKAARDLMFKAYSSSRQWSWLRTAAHYLRTFQAFASTNRH